MNRSAAFAVPTLVLLAAILSPAGAQAGNTRINTVNFEQFSTDGLPSGYACRTQEGVRRLGKLNRGTLAIGAVWKRVSVAREMTADQRKIAGEQAKLERLSNAKKRARQERKIAALQRELNELQQARDRCLNPEPIPTPTPAPNTEPIPEPVPTPTESYRIKGSAFTGLIRGPVPPSLSVTLGSDRWMKTVATQNGRFAFDGVPPGAYFLRAEEIGLDFGRAKTVIVEAGEAAAVAEPQVVLQAATVSPGEFRYHWEEEQESRAGYEYSAYVNTPPDIVYLDEPLETTDASAALKLRESYKIYLSNEDARWDEERADRLLKTLNTLPVEQSRLVPSKWVLTNQELTDDLAIAAADGGLTVTVADAAFTYATPKLVEIEGVKGSFFSKRLHHVVAYFLTNGGADLMAVEKILRERFDVTTQVADYVELTRYTTGEGSNSFQAFYPQERLAIINMFEETPEGFHRTPGLRYLVRRKDGMSNPRNPAAPAIAWQTGLETGYIEFMDFGFSKASADATHRLILHEKAHYLWHWYYPESLKAEWIELGGWFHPDPAQPLLWETTRETEFVSAYAHAHNPDEDMAESLAFYVLNPEWLMSRSPRKFEFVKQRIMHGDRYYSQIREDLTFQVYNLLPDYVYPGKVRRVDIHVAGTPQEDKRVTVEIELQVQDQQFEGAAYAFTRIVSSADPYVDLYLYPINMNAEGIGSILRGSFTLSKHAKNGFWRSLSLDIYDAVGNARFQSPSTYGWKLYIDNPLEDLVRPEYVAPSLTLSAEEQMISGHLVTAITARWQIRENIAMRPSWPVNARLSNPLSTQGAIGEWGHFDAATATASVVFYLTEYRKPGDYGVPELDMIDIAGNAGTQRFFAAPTAEQQPLVTVYVNSANADEVRPELDPNRITVLAEPTNPSAPNGETLVTITLYARDDKSGVGVMAYRLRDPQGGTHFYYHEHENLRTMFFQGEPTEWKQYVMRALLPVGSAPGTWGLQEVSLQDKAGNYQWYNFLETMHFMVSGS